MAKETSETGQAVSSDKTENPNFQDSGSLSEDEIVDPQKIFDEENSSTKESNETSFHDLDDDLVRELNDAVTLLLDSKEDLKRDIKILPNSLQPKYVAPTDSIPHKKNTRNIRRPWEFTGQNDNKNENFADTPILLPLSDTRHSDRINSDIRNLAIFIASTIDKPSQWKTFCEDGGGLLPLLECIQNGARDIRQGSQINDEGMMVIVEQREESFASACSACKTIRDLCAISKPFATIVTDSILTANTICATRVNKTSTGIESFSGGLISDLVTLLRYAGEVDTLYSRQTRKIFQKLRK